MVVLKGSHPGAKTPNSTGEGENRSRQKYVRDKAQLLADEEAKNAVERLRAGEDMEKVAKSYKLDVVTSSFFGRSDSVEGLGQALYVEDAFTKPGGTRLWPHHD